MDFIVAFAKMDLCIQGHNDRFHVVYVGVAKYDQCQKYGTFKEFRLKKQRSVVILGKMTLPYSTSLYSN